MLRGILRVDHFRSMVNWQGDPSAVLGKRTVIYGGNGTGKTTISELLRLCCLDAPCNVHLQIHDGATRTLRLRPGDAAPLKLLVFNRDYVERNLQLFLTGTGTSEPLLVLGQRDVEAVGEREATTEDLVVTRARLLTTGPLDAEARTRISAAENNAKQSVIDVLSGFDPVAYNRTRYRVDIARNHLQGATLAPLPESDVRTQNQVLNTGGLAELDAEPHPGLNGVAVESTLRELLERTISSASIDRLREDPVLAAWVEEGLPLHDHRDACQFCGGALPESLLARYQGHFDDSLAKLRDDLAAFQRKIATKVSQLDSWRDSLPRAEDLEMSVREQYGSQLTAIDERLQRQRDFLDRASMLAQARLDNPFLTPSHGSGPIIEVDGSGADDALVAAVSNHEEMRRTLEERRRVAATKLEIHAISRHQPEFVNATRRRVQVARYRDALTSREARLRQRLTELDASESDSGLLADALNLDLQAYLGHAQLAIEVAAEGAGYHLRRSGQVATDLSEGEKNALALLYFLRSLEVDAVDPSETIVVIDDPVSSMDRDSLFAAYSIVLQRLEGFHQWIIMTHDFDFFRMCRLGLNKAWLKALRRRDAGDAEEEATPSVRFLECSIRVTSSQGQVTRVPTLREMPRRLLAHLTEYHYLFWRVSEALEQSEDDSLPLMPNAARRLLEGFLAFKVPSATDLRSRLDGLHAQYSLDEALVTRVYTFVNRMSHRDDPDPLAGLNFSAIQDELRCVIDLMESADPRHVDGLRKATSAVGHPT
jgi:wobble nucleotide-excising tRNase